jgi:hypothetical protein
MTPIDLTAQIGSLLAGLDIMLVISATAIAISAWRHQSSSLHSVEPRSTVVRGLPSAPAQLAEAPSDPSFPEAA